MNHRGFANWLAPVSAGGLRPQAPRSPIVEVAIVPASPAEAGPVVDVTLEPRYKVEPRGRVWLVIDTTAPKRQWPTFRSEACAIACVAALNQEGPR